MKRGIIVLLILAVIVLAGCAHRPLVGGDRDRHGCIGSAGYSWCVPKHKCLRAWEEPCVTAAIHSFEDCVNAGYPVMESHPRQCRANGETFVEEIDRAVEPPIGGQRDSHGCLGPAGYTWDYPIGACVREWEMNDLKRAAAKAAVDKVGEQHGLTVVEIISTGCPGCYKIKLSDLNYAEKIITLEAWKVVAEAE